MIADGDGRFPQDDSAFSPGTWEEDNPFEQEEVLPSSSRDQGEARPDADYVPEDAVVEYGQEGQEFYDPSGGASVEDDSVFLTESIAPVGEVEEPEFGDVPDPLPDLAHQ